MRITVPTLAAAISLWVFACSELPSSPSADSSSSEVPSSSSNGANGNGSSSSVAGKACEYSGEEFGISGLLLCEDIPGDMPNLQTHKIECGEDGGTWVNNACPAGERTVCISEENEYEKEILYKLYTDSIVCGDLMLKNTNGSEDIVSKGGACGPFFLQEGIPISMCIEFPEISTVMIKFSCTHMEYPFASECPGNADLTCYIPENETISHIYGKEASLFTCKDLNMEEL